MTIDYARMKKLYPLQKGRLTRALKIEDADRRHQVVIEECAQAVREWDEIGAWPDDWSRWQRALDDVYPLFSAPRLESLNITTTS